MIGLKPSKIVTITIETKNDMAFYSAEMETERTQGWLKFTYLYVPFMYVHVCTEKSDFDSTKFVRA